MKIKRVVNGQEMEFELTNMEVIQAFWEQEECHMKEDMKFLGILQSPIQPHMRL